MHNGLYPAIRPLLIFQTICRLGLVNVNEEKQQEALRVHYSNLRKVEEMKKMNRIRRLRKFSLVINLLICIGFVLAFWVAGMSNYYKEV